MKTLLLLSALLALSACGKPADVKATSIDTSYIVAGVIRCDPSDNTWYVEENVNHASTGIASVETLSDRLRVHYTFSAGYTVSFSASQDATYSQVGIIAGGAVGPASADILIGQNGAAITPLEACAYPTGNFFIFGMFKGQ